MRSTCGELSSSLEQMAQQSLFDLVGRSAAPSRGAGDPDRSGQGKDVADHGLGLLVDAEDVAGDLAGLQRRVAGQHVVVEILHQQLGRGAVVPVQALLPQLALGLQHGAQHRRRKVPQVENLDGNARCHVSSSSNWFSAQD